MLDSLESLARTGWMLRGVPASVAETVSVHSYRAAVIALVLGFEAKSRGLKVDPFRTASIALVHDMGEGYIGDISKTARIDKCKSEAEMRAIRESSLPSGVKDLYYEFEHKETVEAQLAKVSEQLATLIRAYGYRKLGFKVDDIIESTLNSIQGILDEMEDNVRGVIKPLVESMIAEVKV